MSQSDGSQRELTGYLGTYWEQGMEESPWLIFQDARFAQTPQEGWDIKGMHRLEPGARLTIFDQSGDLLLQHTLRPTRTGLWARLFPKEDDWFPKGMSAECWENLFYRSPPLRARYLPPA